MGRASRWLKGLFSGASTRKKDLSDNPPLERKKLGWSFSGRKGSSYREKPGSCHVTGAPARARVGSMDEEESRRAIAVATATAVAAEAAVAAAEAAASVVWLTSRRRSSRSVKVWAAVRIQSVFRGYLARRALKALKGLVKIQALVRGHIVRKQAAETLRCMQALVRVQAKVRAGRVLADARLPNKQLGRHGNDPSKNEVKESWFRIDDRKTEKSNSLKRNGSRVKNSTVTDKKEQHACGLNWLEQWVDERCYHDHGHKKDKILEIDASRAPINSRCRRRHHSICSTLTPNQSSHGFTAMPDSPSKDSTVAQHSLLSSSSVEMQQHSSSPIEFPYEGDLFYSACSRLGVLRSGPFTTTKSECSNCFSSGFSEYPNYMSNTESSKLKARSHSAPRQRPELEKLGLVKKNLVPGFGTHSQPFSSSQRSSMQLKFAGKAYPGAGKLGLPIKTQQAIHV